MTIIQDRTNRERVEDTLLTLLETDENGNSYRYFRASDLAEIGPEVSGAIAGSHLPQIEDDSPLSNGLIVERYNDTDCGPTLWIVRREKS
ncbi:hypothetical protein [Halococcus salifodinae]|uniref:Uncharacterized protein n=1 Tax=Halococcus salifodinae DSM 8989 TaxID=1227456 RepID=M0NDU4_9EURY|nr:hypothetical protein [Halococcus salifodinae]EMA54860.1 hypothetical protein C450_04538 [Halococcus salifodinae DSM 8989]